MTARPMRGSTTLSLAPERHGAGAREHPEAHEGVDPDVVAVGGEGGALEACPARVRIWAAQRLPRQPIAPASASSQPGARAKLSVSRRSEYLLDPPRTGQKGRDLDRFLGDGSADVERLDRELLAVTRDYPGSHPRARTRAGRPTPPGGHLVTAILRGPLGALALVAVTPSLHERHAGLAEARLRRPHGRWPSGTRGSRSTTEPARLVATVDIPRATLCGRAGGERPLRPGS